MRAPWSWLLSLCDPGLEPAQLAERLSMTGTEVERVGHVGTPSPESFVMGWVLTADPHPDADRLRVCSVDTGEAEPRTIVCGAPNVAAGQSVAVALPGAVMPDGTRLGKAKLRGVSSEGMILSAAELGIGEDAGGILVFDGGPAPGTPLGELLAISETLLELEITPNRPDCLGIYGVAREVHAITGAELAPEPWAEDAEAAGEGKASDYASVKVEVPELCPRFTARVFTDVTIGPSPLWLKARLSAAGQRPINNVVDITNYVMLLTGQPLHAFDLDRVGGGELVVRTASEGETMTTLDDVERSFDAEAVLVCDREGPSGIAGIMGGQRSEVSAATTRVLLEVATWNGPNILRTSSRLGLRSEASSRFEKQLHPDLTMRGQRVASALFVELCGARLVPGTIDVDAGAFGPRRLRLRSSRMRDLLGMEVPQDLASGYLGRLGFGVDAGEGEIAVEVPADRYFDTTREVDLIEEVARVHGLDEHLPATLPARGAAAGRLSAHQRLLRRAEDLVRDAGLDQVITWSFVDPSAPGRLGLSQPAIRVHNPLSEDQSQMRTTLLGGLLDTAAYNLARGAAGVALFESGRVYLPEPMPAEGGVADGHFAGDRPAPAREPHRIACLLSGPAAPAGWRGEARFADFYDAKGLLELLCAGVGAAVTIEANTRPFLHPGRAATISLLGSPAGWLGELHPRLAAGIDAAGPVGFELDAGLLFAAASEGHERYEDVTTFPAVYEDIAVVAKRSVPAAAIHAAVLEGGGKLLRSATVFDLYEGEQIAAGHYSLALRLEFRVDDRTLTDAEVAEQRTAIVAAIERAGGTLR